MKVAVIGAGVVGVTTAYYLRRHGFDVTVVERERQPARGTSYGNGGYLETAVTEPFNGPGALKLFMQAWLTHITGRGSRSAFLTRTRAIPGLIGWGLHFLRYTDRASYLAQTVKNMRLAQYSVQSIKDIAEQESLAFSQSDAGALIVFRDEARLGAYAEVARHVEERGARFALLDRPALLAKEPSLTAVGDKLVGAVFFPDDYAGNSRQFCERLTAKMQSGGVEFAFDTPVTSIHPRAQGVDIGTQYGDLHADAVVIAAGNYSKPLARPLGIKLPIQPCKGYSISAPMGEWKNRPRHTIVDMGKHAGVNPLGDVLRVAGTAEFAGMRPGISEQRIDYLIGLVGELYPEFADAIDRNNIDPWAGHRPLSVDGVPMVGASGVDRVFVNSGHGGLGWTQSAGSSRALADLIAGATSRFDLTDFSPTRFS